MRSVENVCLKVCHPIFLIPALKAAGRMIFCSKASGQNGYLQRVRGLANIQSSGWRYRLVSFHSQSSAAIRSSRGACVPQKFDGGHKIARFQGFHLLGMSINIVGRLNHAVIILLMATAMRSCLLVNPILVPCVSRPDVREPYVMVRSDRADGKEDRSRMPRFGSGDYSDSADQ